MDRIVLWKLERLPALRLATISGFHADAAIGVAVDADDHRLIEAIIDEQETNDNSMIRGCSRKIRRTPEKFSSRSLLYDCCTAIAEI